MPATRSGQRSATRALRWMQARSPRSSMVRIRRAAPVRGPYSWVETVAQSRLGSPSGPIGSVGPLMVAPVQASSATWIVNATRAPFGSGIGRTAGSAPATGPIRSSTRAVAMSLTQAPPADIGDGTPGVPVAAVGRREAQDGVATMAEPGRWPQGVFSMLKRLSSALVLLVALLALAQANAFAQTAPPGGGTVVASVSYRDIDRPA